MKRLLTVLALLICASTMVLAQRTITGTITDDVGDPLIGANVLVKGTTVGTVTDFDGQYSLEVPQDATTLVVSYTGYSTSELNIAGKDVVDVVLSEGVTLETAVITALGISRDQKALGYSVQKVGGDEISTVPETNFVQSLSGKVSGVNIRQANTMGGSANVLIRGQKSLTGNNQALYVVNGVPIDNSYSSLGAFGGYDYGNAAMDINPNDIESVQVLKGAAATALYGSRAANGVISITTKKGGTNKKGLGVSYSSNLVFSNADKASMPKWQNQYGGGYGPFYEDATGYFFETDFDGDGTQDLIVPTSEDASWGAKFDPNLMVIHWDALDPSLPQYGQKRPWVVGENGLDYFFRTGQKWNNNVSINGSNDKGSFRLSFSRLDEKGILPNSKIDRNTLSFGSSYNLSDRITASINSSFISGGATGRYGTGYDGKNVMQSFGQWFQTNVDFADLEKYWLRPDGSQLSWNSGYYDDIHPIYFDNPYWVRNKNFQDDNRDRIFGNIQMDFDLLEWLTLTGRVALDDYSETRNDRTAVGSVDLSDFTTTTNRVRETNIDVFLRANKYFDDFSVNAMIGTNNRDRNFEGRTASTVGGLIIPNLYSVENSVSPKSVTESVVNRNSYSGFGSLSLGYKNFLYVDFTDRYDVTSTLPKGNNGYNYFSLSGSFVFSELMNSNAISFGKLRGSYGEVGNDAPAYSTRSTYTQNTSYGNVPLFSVNNTLQNPNLKPERTKSIEGGLEMRFVNDRLGFDVAFYKDNSVDQIMPVSVSSASGNSTIWVNGGEIENKGIELTINTTPVKTNSLKWDVGMNWTRNRNKVLSLYGDTKNLLVYSAWDASINHTIGQPAGVIRGTDFKMTDGKRTVDANGYYLNATDENGNEISDAVLGNIYPDWNMGITTAINFKGLVISALFDIQRGGSIYSINTKYGQATGLYEETAVLNDKGNPIRDQVADGGGIKFDAVKEDGSPNDIYTPAYRWGRAFYYNNSPTARYVFDASYAKFRELVIGYNFPKSMMQNWPITGLNVSFIGRNLAILHKNVKHFDPETSASAGNRQGIESGSYPSTRNLGFSVRVDF